MKSWERPQNPGKHPPESRDTCPYCNVKGTFRCTQRSLSGITEYTLLIYRCGKCGHDFGERDF